MASNGISYVMWVIYMSCAESIGYAIRGPEGLNYTPARLSTDWLIPILSHVFCTFTALCTAVYTSNVLDHLNSGFTVWKVSDYSGQLVFFLCKCIRKFASHSARYVVRNINMTMFCPTYVRARAECFWFHSEHRFVFPAAFLVCSHGGRRKN